MDPTPALDGAGPTPRPTKAAGPRGWRKIAVAFVGIGAVVGMALAGVVFDTPYYAVVGIVSAAMFGNVGVSVADVFRRRE